MLLCSIFSYGQKSYKDFFNSISYDNNDGDASWLGNWEETEPFDKNNSPSTGKIQIINDELRYTNLRQNSEILSRKVNLTDASVATLSFDWRASSLETGEKISLQISDESGSYITLATFGDGNNISSRYRRNISDFIGDNLSIRFVNVDEDWSDETDQFFVDNFQINSVFLLDKAPEITVAGDSKFCLGASTSKQIVDSVSIIDPDNKTLDEISIQISTGYQNGSDLLSLEGSFPNIESSWDEIEGRLMLEGPARIETFEAAILSVQFSTKEPVKTGFREFSIVIGSAFFLPETGHYYEFVDGKDIRWDDARDNASSRTFFGLQGYLATLTNETEAKFAGDQIRGNGWIGAADDLAEGQWRWVTGPEAGTVFWKGDQNGSVVPGQYAFWNTGEPNDYSDPNVEREEGYAHITADGIGIDGSWNDLAIEGGGGDFQARGYMVEYGGLPGDPDLKIAGVTRMYVGCATIITNRNITYRIRPKK